MNVRKLRALFAGVLLMAALFSARQASAFCQTTSCDPSKSDCKPNAAGCSTVGLPLAWASNCVSVSVQAEGAPSQQIDYDAAEASVTRAFAAWTSAACTGGKPSISVQVKGPISCDASEYNKDRSNANIVVFRDTWPYVGGEDALGLTRLRFNPDTGELYDSDIEVNTVTEPLSVGEANPGAVDLDSLLTHEAGHLLGLGHTLEAGATMFSGYKLGSVELRSLTPDDVAGVCGIYPPNRQVSSTSCEPRHGFSDSCGADQPAPTPEADPEPAESSCSFSIRRTSPVGALVLGLLLAFGLQRRRRLVAASLTTAALAGCSLDNRQLQYAMDSGGQAGASSPVLPSAGSDQGGSAGQGADGPVMIDGCIDLDQDGVPDCDETLIENATFNTDVDAWHADGEALLKWDERNAAGDLPSGSALIDVDTGAPGGALQSASQCLTISGPQLVTVYAHALVASEQAGAGQAQIDVLFFDGEDCAGPYATSFSTPQPLDAVEGEWFALKAGMVTGANTKSVLVKLAVSRSVEAASAQALFDNVLLKALPQ